MRLQKTLRRAFPNGRFAGLWLALVAVGAVSTVGEPVYGQPAPPDAGVGLISAVSQMWLRSHGLVWEGPRVLVEEVEPPAARLASSAPGSVLLAEHGVRPLADALRAAQRGLSLARLSFSHEGWRTPEDDPFELYIMRGGDPSEPRAHVRLLRTQAGHDRARTFATVEQGLFAFDPEACSVDAYARAMLLALDPSESADWRQATARALTIAVLGRSCTDPFGPAQEAPLSDPAVLRVVRSVVNLRELWELGQQRTWEGVGLRASPNLWEVLAYVVQGRERERSADDVWEQFAQRMTLARALVPKPAQHPPFVGKTRRIWGEIAGLEPLSIEAVRFAVGEGQPLQIWLHGEPGTQWLLHAQARDAAGRTLAGFGATSKARVDRSKEVVVYHPLEAPTGTQEVVITVGNLGAGSRALATPELHRRGYYLVIGRAK